MSVQPVDVSPVSPVHAICSAPTPAPAVSDDRFYASLPVGGTTARIVIAGAGPAARALVAKLYRAHFQGSITVLSNRDEAPDALMELAALPGVSLRLGQPATHIDPAAQCVTTEGGLELGYDQLVIATGSGPVLPPIDGACRCLRYSSVDDAAAVSNAIKEASRVLGRRPLGILIGTGTAAEQAEALLRSRGVRPVRTSARPASAIASLPGSPLPVTGVRFQDGSTMLGDLVVLAEDHQSLDFLAASAGLRTAPGGGILIGHDFRTSVSGIWAIGDAAALDGVRLGLVLPVETAAGACTVQLMASCTSPPVPAGA